MARRETFYGFLLILLLGILIYVVSIVPPAAAQAERDMITQARSLEAIAANPLSLPYKLAVYTTGFFSDSVRAVRALGIIFFGLCVVALYRILKRWHSDIIALLTSALFATSASALTVARLASPQVLLFGWPLVIAVLLWVQHGTSKKIAPLTLMTISAMLLYVPGSLYFFMLLTLLFIPKISNILVNTKPIHMVGASFLFIFLLTPLILSFWQNTALISEWLLLPNSIDWSTVPRNILRVPSAFIYRAPADPLINVGRLPILDVASGALMLLGLYTYVQNVKLERTKIILLTGLFSIIIGALGALSAAIFILMPFVFVVIAAGMSNLLDRWYAVFPKNPFARGFGLLLVTTVVMLSMFYQLTRFFIVWPLTPETRNTYNLSRLIQ